MFLEEDVQEFRANLYRTDEKRDQNDFLSNFIYPEDAKSHSVGSKNPKLLNINYRLPKINGDNLIVCKELFQTVTGFGDSKCRGIFMKTYKNDLLKKGEEAADVLFKVLHFIYPELSN